MNNYNAIDRGTTTTPRQTNDDDDNNNEQRPHLYSTPSVSAPLITWFGRPTVIEVEQPVVVAEEEEQLKLEGVIAEEEEEEEGESEFKSIKGEQPHVRSYSQPAYSISRACRDQQQLLLKQQQQQQRRARSKSLFWGGTNGNGDSATAAAAVGDSMTQPISAYTYRVRTIDTSDEHRLRLRQNIDGTYSYVDQQQQTIADDDDNNIPDNYSSETTGMIMMSSSSSSYRKSENLKASVSLDTVMNLEMTLSDMENKTLPPHIHPSIPSEILNPEFTKTAPPLTLWPLAVLVFYNVSGGPFGIEPSIRAGGNFYAILGFIIFPFIWAVPEALVTAELGAAFQDPSAGVAWVEHAFGEGLGGLVGTLAWVSGATDNAIYPTLFIGYVSSVFGWDKDEFGIVERFCSVVAITICLAMLNYTGLEIVGNASLAICIIAMSPFLIMTIIGAPKVVPSRWFQLPESTEDAVYGLFDDDFQTSAGPLPLLSLGGILWRPFLNNMFWNINGFDKAASFAGETSSASTTYPRGVFIGLVMCVVSYIFPLLVAVGATDYRQTEWVDGHLGTVAVDIGGKWLGMWTIFAAGISNVALFEAEMSSDAFKIMGMAEHGYLPRVFKMRSKYGTPTAGIMFNTLVIIVFSCADFGQLLQLLNSVYAMALLLEYAAFVKLRLFHKELQRPYRVPVPDWVAVLIVIPPTVGIVFVFATSNWFVYVFCAGALLLGYSVSKASKSRGWAYESKGKL